MTIYVDGLQSYFGRPWCWMMCDGNQEELHRIARMLSLKRRWYHERQRRYEMMQGKRARAISLGAVSVSRSEMLKLCS